MVSNRTDLYIYIHIHTRNTGINYELLLINIGKR